MPPRLATIALLAALSISAYAQHDRAIWFWQSPQSPFGSVQVIGNATQEDATIVRLKSLGVNTVYGSYAGDALTNPAALHAWNRKLAAAGIASYLLLSETEYIFPASLPALTKKLTAAFITFNAHSQPTDRFTGLAFDIEPHILPAWKTSDPLARRAYLGDLLNLYQHIRTLIGPTTPLEATLPMWYSHTTGTIGWANALDRDQYFAALSATCDRFSIMAFEIPDPANILKRTGEEITHLNGKARLALRANLGHEWQTPTDFWSAVSAIESATLQGIEIQDYALIAAYPKTTTGTPEGAPAATITPAITKP